MIEPGLANVADDPRRDASEASPAAWTSRLDRAGHAGGWRFDVGHSCLAARAVLQQHALHWPVLLLVRGDGRGGVRGRSSPHSLLRPAVLGQIAVLVLARPLCRFAMRLLPSDAGGYSVDTMPPGVEPGDRYADGGPAHFQSLSVGAGVARPCSRAEFVAMVCLELWAMTWRSIWMQPAATSGGRAGRSGCWRYGRPESALGCSD